MQENQEEVAALKQQGFKMLAQGENLAALEAQRTQVDQNARDFARRKAQLRRAAQQTTEVKQSPQKVEYPSKRQDKVSEFFDYLKQCMPGANNEEKSPLTSPMASPGLRR